MGGPLQGLPRILSLFVCDIQGDAVHSPTVGSAHDPVVKDMEPPCLVFPSQTFCMLMHQRRELSQGRSETLHNHTTGVWL